MRIAVSGSRGFIGTHLVTKLKELKFDIVEISRETGYDLNHFDSVKDIAPCDVIIHLAAKTFVPDSFDNPRGFYRTNLNLTINALELARNWKAKVIYMSSYFYGPPQYIPVDENHPLNPHNPYAQTKYMSEELCKAYSRDFDLSVVAFRLFNIYGPGQTGSFLIPEILEKVKYSGRITLKDPRPKRDYIHVSDVVSAIERTIDYDFKGFQVFNLGTGVSVSVEELVSIIQKYSPDKFEVEYLHEYRKGEVLDSIASVREVNEVLNWRPSVDLTEGVKTLFL